MRTDHTAAIGIFHLSSAANDDFAPPALDVDQVDMIAVMVLERQFQQTAFNLDIPVHDMLAGPFLRSKAQLLQPVLHRLVVIISRFMINFQEHIQFILS